MKKLQGFLLLTSLLVPTFPLIANPSEEATAEAAAATDCAQANAEAKERKERRKNKQASPSKKLKACEEDLVKANTAKAKAEHALADAKKKTAASARIASKVKALETEVKQLRDQKVKAEAALALASAKPSPSSTSKSSTGTASNPSIESHESALKEIDNCLAKASSKAKELAEVIRNAQKEKVAAQNKAKAADKELADVRKEMDAVVLRLAQMKERDGKNQQHLKDLETKLTLSAKNSEAESKKLIAAANDLSAWEKRAKRAESDLQRTKEAMQTSLKVANEAKALGSQFQEKLSLSATQLVEKDNSLAATLASLKKSQKHASDCQARVNALQAEIKRHEQQYSATTTALKKAETARDAFRKSKLAAEKSLTTLKGQLASSKRKADQLPELHNKIAILEATVTSNKEAESRHLKETQKLADSSAKLQLRLNEILTQREELHDHLTVLRNEFAQYRITAKNTQSQASQSAVNQLQVSLARATNERNAQLVKRDFRLVQLEKSLRAKEQALQAAYKREKALSSKLGETNKSHQQEAAARLSLSKALEKLRTDLEDSEKKACKLQEQLGELEKLGAE